MKRLLNWLVTGFVLVLIGSYAWTHKHHIAVAVATPAQQEAETDATYAEVHEAQRVVGVAGPLANYVAHQEQPKVETVHSVSGKATALDHVGGSVVGTSSPILHSTFGVKSTVNLPFEVPAHAATPRLCGTYRSFVKQSSDAGLAESSDAANVEFLVLNESQYAEFQQGRDSEAVFSAEDAHDQEVNTGLPPTINQPAKYHLIFRNSSHETGEKIVQADFHIDF